QTRVFVQPFENWLTKRCKEKIFRTLEFSKPEGVDKAMLSFLNDKLVVIFLDMKKGISASDLANNYGMPFSPVGSGDDLPLRAKEFEVNRRTEHPRTGEMYHLVGISER